jgi:hypothetical protein
MHIFSILQIKKEEKRRRSSRAKARGKGTTCQSKCTRHDARIGDAGITRCNVWIAKRSELANQHSQHNISLVAEVKALNTEASAEQIIEDKAMMGKHRRRHLRIA